MGLNVEIGGPSVISDSFNASAGMNSGMQLAANNTPVTPSQLFPVKVPASEFNARKLGMG